LEVMAIETKVCFSYSVEIHVLYSTNDFANEILNETMIHLNKIVIYFEICRALDL
jgi:hypothetical protein